MGKKRVAGTDLNHDNWNQEEEEEDAGEFKKASNDVLQQRVRKIAKRRGMENSAGVSNPFSGFGGFGSSATVTSTPSASNPSPFSFLAKLPAATATTTTTIPKTNGELKTKTDDNVEFFSKVKALNIAFVDWIKKHTDEDSLCDLTPVFKDYEKYMKDFEKLKNKPKVGTDESKKDTLPPAAAAASTSTFSFDKPTASNSTLPITSNNNTGVGITFGAKQASPAKPTESSKDFSFGLKTPSSTPAPFSFGLAKTSTTTSGIAAPPPLFGSFSSSTPFSFGNVGQSKVETAKSDANAGGGGEEEESEEPPKNEFKAVVEEDSLYSKRCKVYVKSGNDYADRGVGTLYLKKVDDKIQLIVRADTNLGNIILNIIITEGLPVSRTGKNNVMIICVPTPDSKPPPVSVLVRVKTGDEADELLTTLEKYKKE